VRNSGSWGINIHSGSVIDCTIIDGQDNGIETIGPTVISGCSISGCGGYGIRLTRRSQVSGNALSNNGTGIYARSSGPLEQNRIDANNLVNNDTGIDVNSGGNLIIRNSVWGGTTSYDIAPANSYGEIIDVSGVGEFANASPWANFEY
jgi:parallel beta-helix repeat protein